MKKLVLILALTACLPLSGQPPSFEVASIRQNITPPSRFPLSSNPPMTFGYRWLPGGDFTIIGMPLMNIIATAYDAMGELSLFKFDATEIPQDLLRTRFDIRAKGEGDPRAMLRSLLTERFNLRTHGEVRDIPIYVLSVAYPPKLGPGLQPSEHNCREYLARGGRRTLPDAPPPCRSTVGQKRNGFPISRDAGTIAELVSLVVQANADRPVVNRTGLEGNFQWEVVQNYATVMAADPDRQTIFQALEDQLGLRLQPIRGPYEIIVIDELSMPTPN